MRLAYSAALARHTDTVAICSRHVHPAYAAGVRGVKLLRTRWERASAEKRRFSCYMGVAGTLAERHPRYHECSILACNHE